jgi:hypothetical protein
MLCENSAITKERLNLANIAGQEGAKRGAPARDWQQLNLEVTFQARQICRLGCN